MNTTTTDRIAKEIVLRAPLARVWRAISDPDEFGSWFRVDMSGVRFEPGKVQEALQRGRAYVEEVLEAGRLVPGIELAGAVEGGLPLTGSWSRTPVKLAGRGELQEEDDSVDLR